MAGPEERSHLIEYGVVGVFIYEALTERASHGRRVPAVPVLAILATAAIGLLDEFIQVFLPSRVFDPLDILFNLLAAAMAVGASATLAWARRWSERPGGHIGAKRRVGTQDADAAEPPLAHDRAGLERAPAGPLTINHATRYY